MADKSQWTLIMKTDISCRNVSGFMSLIPRKTKERRTSSQYEERFSFTSVVKFPSSLCLEEGLCLFKIVGPLGNFPHHQLTKRQGDAISKQCVPFRQRIVVVWSLILEYCCVCTALCEIDHKSSYTTTRNMLSSVSVISLWAVLSGWLCCTIFALFIIQ